MIPRKFKLRAAGCAITALALCWCSTANAAEVTIDEEIIKLRKELSRQQIECQRIIGDIDKENKSYADYRTGLAQRTSTLLAALDTLKRDMSRVIKRNDSLAAAIDFARVGIRQIDNMQESTRLKIIAVCTYAESVAKRQPPLAAQTLVASLALLKSDVTEKSIDNIESSNRLFTIISQLEESAASIQVSQESSPSPDIRGTVYRLRLGSFFEGAVDEKGEKAVIFSGYNPDGSIKWKNVDNAFATAIRTASVIREGKSLPAFVRLPILDTLTGGAAQ